MFELIQLRCFVAVAEELHFGRAASRLNMTQPPLSRQVQILEHLVGVTLLERTSRSVRLTAAGRSFLVDARRIVKLAEQSTALAQRVARGELGSLSLGFTAASGYSFLPRLLEQIRGNLPGIDLQLTEMVTPDQLDALRNGSIDLGLLRPPVSLAEFGVIPALQEALVIAAPASGPLSTKRISRLHDLEGLPFIMYAPAGAGYFHDLLTERFYALGIAPRYVQFVSQIHSILALVGAGMGYGLVPAGAQCMHMDGVRFEQLDDADMPPVELVLCHRRSNDNPALARLLEYLQQEEPS
ncbi:MAG: LysR family transcriptional regulator [Steroidobacteraceae bacterium]